MGDTFLYKNVFSYNMINELNMELDSAMYTEYMYDLAPRNKLEGNSISIPMQNKIKKYIRLALSEYVNIISISNIRFYSQSYGSTKAHYDVPLDGKSTHTLLIYLTDTFEGGELTLKCKIPKDGMKNSNEFILHVIKPKVGHGVLFNKNIFHWANEVYGTKSIMMIDLFIKN